MPTKRNIKHKRDKSKDKKEFYPLVVLVAILAVVLLIFFRLPLFGAVTFQPGTEGKDTYIAQDQPSRNYGGASLLILSSEAGKQNNVLLEFNLSSIPKNATVQSATLVLEQINTASGSINARVHRVTQPWKEGTKVGTGTADGATWSTRDGTAAWSTPGGTYDPFVYSSITITQSPSTRSWNVTQLVQQWVSGTHPNNGLIIVPAGLGSSAFGTSSGEWTDNDFEDWWNWEDDSNWQGGEWGDDDIDDFWNWEDDSDDFPEDFPNDDFVMPDDDEEDTFEKCTDGIDNDRDGLTDCADTICALSSVCRRTTPPPAPRPPPTSPPPTPTPPPPTSPPPSSPPPSSPTTTPTQIQSVKVYFASSDYTTATSKRPKLIVQLAAAPVCGNGIKENNEQCDDGNVKNGDGCSATCQIEGVQAPLAACGDGQIQQGEQCDPPGQRGVCAQGQVCNNSCQCVSAATAPVCGNGILESGENCDDGNRVNGDGCTSSCQREFCGDGIVQSGLGEQCEFPNTSSCNSNCKIVSPAVCGNGVVESGEQCDSSNLNGSTCTSIGQGFTGGNLLCTGSCTFDTSQCTTTAPPPPPIAPPPSSGGGGGGGGGGRIQPLTAPAITFRNEDVVCGNGLLDRDEECDDGNTIPRDGCSSLCKRERAAQVCGNDIVEGIEQCDDGNLISGDGCSRMCVMEIAIPTAQTSPKLSFGGPVALLGLAALLVAVLMILYYKRSRTRNIPKILKFD